MIANIVGYFLKLKINGGLSPDKTEALIHYLLAIYDFYVTYIGGQKTFLPINPSRFG